MDFDGKRGMKAVQNLLYSIILVKKPDFSFVSTPKYPIFACPVRQKGPTLLHTGTAQRSKSIF